ncbi:MAG: hypothetical protein KDB14_17345 [Planctomycetales bacterium]|nr:hypothetical protein [Planctomycetales bacterium]
MSAVANASAESRAARVSAAWPSVWLATVMAIAWCAAALMPLGASVLAVFLFAAPHNWMEARYLLQRMPAKWGPLRRYYLTGIGGAVALALASLALPSVARGWRLTHDHMLTALAIWNSALVAWIVALADLRRREKLRRSDSNSSPLPQWPWLYAAGWLLLALAWWAPVGWSLALVYLHPLIALWFLDRELKRRNVAWLPAYRRALTALPCLLVGLWALLWNAPDLPGDDLLSLQITRHAGRGVVPLVSTQLLVATHVFLEMLHYAVWLLAIPSVGVKGAWWSVGRIPLARKSSPWRVAVSLVLGGGLLAVALFWAGFLINYPLTRDVYFSVAILHVLAEAPFLLRLL